MEKNKTSKYFKYAVGEFILVVIGILIALAINNLNQNRLSNQRQQIYLKNFKEELASNVKLLLTEDSIHTRAIELTKKRL